MYDSKFYWNYRTLSVTNLKRQSLFFRKIPCWTKVQGPLDQQNTFPSKKESKHDPSIYSEERTFLVGIQASPDGYLSKHICCVYYFTKEGLLCT